MSIEAVRDAVTQAASGRFVCEHATMSYLDGGKRELFRLMLRGGRTVEIIVPGGSENAEIARLAVAASDEDAARARPT